MLKKDIILKFAIILLIFSVGFFLRFNSANLNGIPAAEKDFYQDQAGLPYMYELDSYYNYRLTKNYLDHGYLGDTKINGIEWDLYSYYPPGVPMDYPPLIVYLTAFIYKLINIFSQIPLLTICFWIPAFIAPLSGILAYFFVSRLTNDFGGFAAGILAVISPFYFLRSVPGWFDTDMFIIFFSILVVWFFIEAFQSKNKRNRVVFAFLSAFSMFLFSIAWNGWQYLFLLLISFSLIYIIYSKLTNKNVANIFYTFSIFFIGSISLILIFTGYLSILKLYSNIFEIFKLTGSQNIWAPFPDLYLSVSELSVPSPIEVVAKIDPILFGLGIFALIFMPIALKKKENYLHFNNINWFLYSFLVLWIFIGFITLLKGVRFIMLLLPPLIISVGIMVGILIEYLKTIKIKKIIFYFSFICIILLVSLIPALNTYDTSKVLKPGVNDDLWSSAEWIHVNTPNNTVIINEWSYGHFLSSIADRSVVLDGRSAYIETLPIRAYYNNPAINSKSPGTSRDYWITRAFTTNNETLSAGIFKMISTSGDRCQLILDNYTGNTTKSVEILNNILGIDKEVALNVLTKNYQLKQEEAKEVLEYTHPDNQNPFIIFTCDSMINNAKGTFDFGEWDFRQLKSNNYTYSVGDINTNGTALNTTNNVTINMENNVAKWKGKIPYCYIEIKNGLISKYYLDKNSSFCVYLRMDDKKSIVIDKKFENSVFTKLVIEKSNSTSYKPIYKNKSVIIWELK
jgi:dolichyl-diphosphooligosaccharide--protein glycosyltransferase